MTIQDKWNKICIHILMLYTCLTNASTYKKINAFYSIQQALTIVVHAIFGKVLSTISNFVYTWHFYIFSLTGDNWQKLLFKVKVPIMFLPIYWLLTKHDYESWSKNSRLHFFIYNRLIISISIKKDGMVEYM